MVLIALHLTLRIPDPDFDLWARLAVGSLFFQTGWVLKHDIFSYVPTKDLWIDHEWGSGVIFFNLIHYFGINALFFLKFLIILAIFLLIIEISALKSKHLMGPVYLFLVGYSLFPSLASQVRSQAFTFLFFALWIYVLERVRKGENRILWIIPVTTAIWANLHGGFIAGFGLLAIYALGELFNKRNPVKYILTLLASILFTLINPYGIHLWWYIWDAATLNRLGFIEWQPIDLMGGPFHYLNGIPLHILLGFVIFTVLTLLIGIKQLVNKKNPDWVKIIALCILSTLGWRLQRHNLFFVIFASSTLFHLYYDLFSSFAENFSGRFYPIVVKIFLFIKKSTIIFLLFFYSLMLAWVKPGILAANPYFYPIRAYEFIKINNITGNLATTYNWGSYALWKLYPQCRVFIDGRYEEVYPNDHFLRALNFSEHVSNSWYYFLNKYHTDIIVAPKSAYNEDDFMSIPDWTIVYSDPVSYVLLPKSRLKKNYIYPDINHPDIMNLDFSRQVNLD